MTDYFASPSGNDANLGTFDSPKLTVQALYNLLGPGDRGFLRAGVYSVSPITNYVLDAGSGTGGTPSAMQLICAYPYEAVTIRGRNVIRNGCDNLRFERINFEQHAGNAFTVIEHYGDNIEFDQCELSNGDQAATGHLVGSNSAPWTITKAKWTRCKYHDIGVAASNLWHPIYLDKINAATLGDVIIQDCLFRDSQGGYIIQFFRDARRVLVEYCTMYNHERGIVISGTDATNYTRNCTIRNCILHTTTYTPTDAWGLTHFWGGSPTVGTGNLVDNNVFFNIAAGYTANGGTRQDGDGLDGYTVSNHQYVDPLFSNVSSGDFTPLAPEASGRGVRNLSEIGPLGTNPATLLDSGPIIVNTPRKTTYDAVDEYSVGRRGLESRILHNNFLINDCRIPDHYKVTEITGLDDVDVRDVREDNPDRDGETAYSAFSGGRTVTIRGYIQAGNFAKLRQMETNLLKAYNSLVESPLEFLYLDEINLFNDSSDLFDWTTDGASQTTVANGHLSLTNVAGTLGYYYSLRSYKENQVTVKIDNPTSSTNILCNLKIKRIDVNNDLRVQWDQTNTNLNIIKTVAGTPTTLATIDTTDLFYGPSIWVRASLFNNVVWAEVWAVDPDEISYPSYESNQLIFTTHALAGGDITTYGSSVSANAGFVMTANNINSSIDTVQVQSLNPGDLRITGRKIGKIEFSEVQTTSKVRRDFLITFRSSNGLLESRVENKYRFNLTTPQVLSFPSAHLTFPIDGSGLVLGKILATVTPGGARNIPARFIFNVSTSECGIGNATSEEFVVFNPTVLKWELDTKKRIVVNSESGENLYSTFGSIHDWIRLGPEGNTITWGVNVTLSEIMLFYRSAY